jgi:hypothetical protein
MLSRHLQGQGFPISCSHDTWSESFLVSHGLNPCAAQTTGFSLSGSYWAGLTPGFPVKRTGGLLPAWYLASTHQSLECGVRMTSPAACAGLTWSTARQTNMACVNLKNKHDLCLKRLESQISSHFTRWKGWRALLQVDSQLYYLFMPYWWSLSFLLQFLEKKLYGIAYLHTRESTSNACTCSYKSCKQQYSIVGSMLRALWKDCSTD